MSLFSIFKKKRIKKSETVEPDTMQSEAEIKVRYEYDAERNILIKCSSGKLPKILRKSDLIWRDLGPQDESYARAIFLGQGCWERLDTISEEEAYRILTQWGYSFPEE